MPLLQLCMTSEPQRGHHVETGLSKATYLGDGVADSIAGFVTEPHFLPWGEIRTQGPELTQDGLVRKHLDFIFGLQAQVKKQVLFHSRRIDAVPINEEPAGARADHREGPHMSRLTPLYSTPNSFSSFSTASSNPAVPSMSPVPVNAVINHPTL